MTSVRNSNGMFLETGEIDKILWWKYLINEKRSFFYLFFFSEKKNTIPWAHISYIFIKI